MNPGVNAIRRVLLFAGCGRQPTLWVETELLFVLGASEPGFHVIRRLVGSFALEAEGRVADPYAALG